jgi:hypothetical protein
MDSEMDNAVFRAANDELAARLANREAQTEHLRAVIRALVEDDRGFLSAVNEHVQADVDRIVAERDRAVTRMKELRRALTNLSFADMHGCCTGDCPHRYAPDCVPALIEQLRWAATEATDALEKTEPPRDQDDHG